MLESWSRRASGAIDTRVNYRCTMRSYIAGSVRIDSHHYRSTRRVGCSCRFTWSADGLF
jgi:hypothetical protein